MRQFAVGDVVRRKDFFGMTLVNYNKDYRVTAISTLRPAPIFRLATPDKGLFISLEGIPDHYFDEHNFIMVKKAVPEAYMDDDLFTI